MELLPDSPEPASLEPATGADLPALARLRGGIPIELLPDHVRHPRSRFGTELRTRYANVTHVAVAGGGLRLGTRAGVFLFRRTDFVHAGAPEAIARALRQRIAALPDGAARLARMAQLEALARRPGPPIVTLALAAACVVVFVLQGTSPSYESAGFFSPLLVRLGELWRLVIANLLHSSPGHLILNLLVLAVGGALAERSLGSAGIAVVLFVSGLGAMIGSYLGGETNVVGASGVVCGVIGALLWLEFRRPDALPAGWRIPRRLFVGALLVEGLALLGLPAIAHAAHAGGLATGALAAAAIGPRADRAAQVPRRLRVANAAAAAAFALAVGLWLRSTGDPEAIARRGAAFLDSDEASPDLLNNEAWAIAISDAPSQAALDVARRMAERAALETNWSLPAVLDTLAEIHFVSGRPDLARELASAALSLAPSDPYYRRQLERFGGTPKDGHALPPREPGLGRPELRV